MLKFKYYANKKLELLVNRYYIRQRQNATPKAVHDYIAKFPVPKDDFEMSFFKYKCRMSSFPWYIKATADILSLFALILAFPTLLFLRCSVEQKNNGSTVIEKNYSIDYKDILPDDLIREGNYKIIDYCNLKFGALTKEARYLFTKCFIRYPCYPFFLYITYKELVAHSFFLSEYNPYRVAVYTNERNFASPIITNMYELYDRQFISFMHGDYYKQIVIAFMKFSKYYIWDEYFEGMLRNDLRCGIREYEVYRPMKWKKKWNLETTNGEYDYTYYICGEESESSIKAIVSAFELMKKNNKKCKIRIHPRNLVIRDIVEKEARDFKIEYPSQTSLKESFATTKNVVGLGTSVLYEAYIEGRNVVVDDVSDPFKYKNVRDLGSWIFTINPTRFSSILNAIKKG